MFYVSDYFEQLYIVAEELIRKGHAYVDSLTADEMRAYRGTLTEPGKNSPYRDRSVAENLDLFRRMRAGDFPDGTHVLRAKIDMASPNINLRDPVLYRIRHVAHYGQVKRGVFIRPMTMPIRFRMRSKASPIRFAHWSLKTTGHSTIGSWSMEERRIVRSKSNSLD